MSNAQSSAPEVRTAFITGAGSQRGMGAAIAAQLSQEGYRVALADIDGEGAQGIAKQLREDGKEAVGVQVDITDSGAVQAAVAEAEQALGGRIDTLINAAGIVDPTPIWEVDDARFDRMMRLNVYGAFNCAQAVIPGMRDLGFGRMVWISSMASKAGGGSFGKAHYAASKAAVNGLCQGLARELGAWGITSNAIAPSVVDTGIIAKSVGGEEEAAVLERVTAAIPVGRVGSAADIAAAVSFLVSERAGFITGEILDVNGGAYFS